MHARLAAQAKGVEPVPHCTLTTQSLGAHPLGVAMLAECSGPPENGAVGVCFSLRASALDPYSALETHMSCVYELLYHHRSLFLPS